MAVRVRVKLSIGGASVETAAIANTGFETTICQVLVPGRLARAKWPKLLKKGETQRFESPVGSAPLKLLGEGKVQVVYTDRCSKEVPSIFISSSHEREVLLNDRLLEELEIEILRPAAGLWRFRRDEPGQIRPSENPLIW